MLCEYGCNQEAHYQLKNGKWCCEKNYHRCPQMIKKSKENYIKHMNIFECPYCHKIIRHTHNIVICNQHLNKCKKDYEQKELLKNFDNSKYLKWYNNIIKFRQYHPIINMYKEKHHILPRSLGGSNEPENLVYLTAREHYICHMLLVEIYRKNKIAYTKMLGAFMMMKSKHNSNSRLYEIYRKEYSQIKQKTCCGKDNNNYGKIWIYNSNIRETKLIKKEELESYINDGWEKGRFIKLKNLDRLNKIKQIRVQNKLKKEQHKINQKEKYYNLYQLYISLSWKEFLEKTKYPYTLECLIS